MPFGGGKTLTVNTSGLNWDADLIVPAGYKITVNHITETIAGHGIVGDSTVGGSLMGLIGGLLGGA